MVLVGADRIASNGDTANKIGTQSGYTLSVLSIPFMLPLLVRRSILVHLGVVIS